MAQYKIIANEPITMPAPVGGFTQGRRITFELPDGTKGVVKVADSGDWAATANDAICKQIDQINALHQLGQ